MVFKHPEGTTAEIIDNNRSIAGMMGGEGAIAYLESVPQMSSLELLELATGRPYTHLKEAASAELADRMAVLDAIVFAKRAEEADRTSQQP